MITETAITHIRVAQRFEPSQSWFHKAIVTGTPHYSNQQIRKRPVGALCFSKGTSISFLLNSLGRLLWFFWKVLFFYQFLKRHNVFEIRNESTEIINNNMWVVFWHHFLSVQERIPWIAREAVFLPAKNTSQSSNKSNPRLFWSSFTSLCDWFRKLAPPSQPIKCKNYTYGRPRFPALQSVGLVLLRVLIGSFWFYETRSKPIGGKLESKIAKWKL